ncbi:MAG: transposase [Kiritimatiellae bacterium]|jgi:REP element-mobilizing transposase RayT|nr:transposase [Kiritimatiellia bacterium]
MPGSPLEITRRNLPHWKKEGEIYWITFRVADSLPQKKIRYWREERDRWILDHPHPWDEHQWRDYTTRFSERLETWLDAGMGSCPFRDARIRQPVIECLMRFHRVRHLLHAGVIMPNHVHLLLQPFPGQDLSKLMKGIKGASARACNRILGSRGQFWMDESYDHIVRSQTQYEFYLSYIRVNPIKAKLSEGDYWVKSECE